MLKQIHLQYLELSFEFIFINTFHYLIRNFWKYICKCKCFYVSNKKIIFFFIKVIKTDLENPEPYQIFYKYLIFDLFANYAISICSLSYGSINLMHFIFPSTSCFHASALCSDLPPLFFYLILYDFRYWVQFKIHYFQTTTKSKFTKIFKFIGMLPKWFLWNQLPISTKHFDLLINHFHSTF